MRVCEIVCEIVYETVFDCECVFVHDCVSESVRV